MDIWNVYRLADLKLRREILLAYTWRAWLRGKLSTSRLLRIILQAGLPVIQIEPDPECLRANIFGEPGKGYLESLRQSR
jgi:hypothetical protein